MACNEDGQIPQPVNEIVPSVLQRLSYFLSKGLSRCFFIFLYLRDHNCDITVGHIIVDLVHPGLQLVDGNLHLRQPVIDLEDRFHVIQSLRFLHHFQITQPLGFQHLQLCLEICIGFGHIVHILGFILQFAHGTGALKKALIVGRRNPDRCRIRIEFFPVSPGTYLAHILIFHKSAILPDQGSDLLNRLIIVEAFEVQTATINQLLLVDLLQRCCCILRISGFPLPVGGSGLFIIKIGLFVRQFLTSHVSIAFRVRCQTVYIRIIVIPIGRNLPADLLPVVCLVHGRRPTGCQAYRHGKNRNRSHDFLHFKNPSAHIFLSFTID